MPIREYPYGVVNQRGSRDPQNNTGYCHCPWLPSNVLNTLYKLYFQKFNGISHIQKKKNNPAVQFRTFSPSELYEIIATHGFIISPPRI